MKEMTWNKLLKCGKIKSNDSQFYEEFEWHFNKAQLQIQERVCGKWIRKMCSATHVYSSASAHFHICGNFALLKSKVQGHVLDNNSFETFSYQSR